MDNKTEQPQAWKPALQWQPMVLSNAHPAGARAKGWRAREEIDLGGDVSLVQVFHVVVIEPSPLATPPLWMMQMEQFLEDVDGNGVAHLHPVPAATFAALVDAKMQLVPPHVLMASFVQATNAPAHVLVAQQTGVIRGAMGDLPTNFHSALKA